jgi:hypothetical protein
MMVSLKKIQYLLVIVGVSGAQGAQGGRKMLGSVLKI